MKKALSSLIFIFCMLLLPGNYLEASKKEDDKAHWEFWHTEQVVWKFCKKISGKFETEFKYNQGEHYYTHKDIFLNFSISKDFDMGAGYRNILYKEKTIMKKEESPYFDLTPKFNLGDFKFSTRNRIQYRIFEDSSGNNFRYSNKFKMGYPFKLNKINIQPYVSDEIFIDLTGKDAGDFNRNRFAFGIETFVSKNGKLDLYYLHQSNEKELEDGEIWRNFKVLGAKLQISF